MARPTLGEGETERLHIKISAEELEAVEDWRYANRVPSKSEAVRRLVQIGLGFDALADDIHATSIALVGDVAEAAERQFRNGIVPAKADNTFLRYWGSNAKDFSRLLRQQQALATKIAAVAEPTREMRHHESFRAAMVKANEALDAIERASEAAEKARHNRDLDPDIPF